MNFSNCGFTFMRINNNMHSIVMKNIILFYYFFSYSTGWISICLAVILFLKFRARIILLYLGWILSYTITLLFNNLEFLKINFLYQYDMYNHAPVYIFYFLMTGVQIYFFILLLHSISDTAISTVKKTFYSLVVILTTALGLFPFLITSNSIIRMGFIIFDFKILTMGTYASVFFYIFFILKNYRNTGSIEKRLILRIFLILDLIFLPVWISEYLWNFNFNNTLRPLNSANLDYFISNFISIVLFFKYIFIMPKFSSGKTIPENFIKRFNITRREKDIINMVAAGLLNKEIAGKLSISEITARNHIYNIYQKTGAQSRVDLLNLLNDEMLIK